MGEIIFFKNLLHLTVLTANYLWNLLTVSECRAGAHPIVSQTLCWVKHVFTGCVPPIYHFYLLSSICPLIGVLVFTFQPQRKRQIKSCFRCRGNPLPVDSVIFSGKLLSTVDWFVSCRRTAAKREVPVNTRNQILSCRLLPSFFFFSGPCCEITMRLLIFILEWEHSVPSFYYKSFQFCATPSWKPFAGAVFFPLRSLHRVHMELVGANCSTFFPRHRRHCFHHRLSRLGEISCLRLAHSLLHCEILWSNVFFFAFVFSSRFKSSRFRCIVLRQNMLTHI